MKRRFKEFTDILSSEEMRTIIGGCGSCGWMATDSDSGATTSQCNVDKEEAQTMANYYGSQPNTTAYWCCDSCGSTSYCG